MEQKIMNDKEYYEIVKDIINHPEFQKRKEFMHHENESVYDHVLEVSYYSYLFCKQNGYDYRAAAIGGLLHDFYKTPWQGENIKIEKHKGLDAHGFVHAREALENAWYYFPNQMNEKISNIISTHMFPLNIIPPKYKEAWVVSMIDKRVSLKIFNNPKGLLKYVGIRKENKNE